MHIDINFRQHIVSYGIAAGSTCNVVAMITKREEEGKEYPGPWVEESDASEVRKVFAGWEPEVDALLKVRTSNFSPSKDGANMKTNYRRA